ncbi:MAG: hypothetical protein LOD87_04680, partial [Planifilum fulgidum]
MEWIVIIGLIIYLIFERDRTNRLERELKELKQELASKHQPDPAESRVEGPQRAAEDAAGPPIPASVPRKKDLPKRTPPPPEPGKTSEPAAPRPVPAGGKVAPAPLPHRSRSEWEQLIGGKWLNRIGAFALILGVGFFLKYAFDNNLIPE